MFRIDRKTNAIQPLEACSFSDQGFKERDHLQEWIAKHPSCLGEDLLIIQKEFSGFSGTRERPDLLALDKEAVSSSSRTSLTIREGTSPGRL